MTIVVVAEKPAVARDIANALGVQGRHKGYLEGKGYQITWAIGHLVRLAEPHEMNAAWKKWQRAQLPLIPQKWPLVVVKESREQFKLVKKLLLDAATTSVVCATDAGREGELIFRYIYEKAGCKKPCQRLWISSLTPQAIRAGMQNLRDSSAFDPLAASAKGRSRADWLVGMNLSRSYSLVAGEPLAVGRVQTPTLAMLAERERAIADFKAEEYYELKALFDTNPAGERPKGLSYEDGEGRKVPPGCYEGLYFDARRDTKKQEQGDAEAGLSDQRLPLDRALIAQLKERARGGQAKVLSVQDKQTRLAPPLLYDLTELQRHANRLYGFSAQHTLDLAQSLYESRKLISYPRTDCRHLTEDIAEGLPAIVSAIRGPYEGLLAEGTGSRPLRAPYVNKAKVVEHHAIIPTGQQATGLPREEALLYDLICRRLLAAWHEPYLSATTTVVTQVLAGGEAQDCDHYRSKGSRVLQWGWKVLEQGLRPSGASAGQRRGEQEAEVILPSVLAPGLAVQVRDVQQTLKKTKPPPPMTEARLLTGMETAGASLEDKELSEAMRARGLGTPATRAQIIETLVRRSYVQRQGKALRVTEKGMRLIDSLHPDAKSPKMTGEWEAYLGRIERGEKTLPEFMAAITGFLEELVPKVLQTSAGASEPAPRTKKTVPATEDRPTKLAKPSKASAKKPKPTRPGEQAPAASKTKAATQEPAQVELSLEDAPPRLRPLVAPRQEAAGQEAAGQAAELDLPALLQRRFGFASFRPYQQEVCEQSVQGHNLLVVMPTGAGKSLCYQVPAVARGGTAIIISPLIALMEDQVSKLQALGFAAERIHSGRARDDSREVCRRYLAGALDFLYIAPERLGLSGFIELLSRRQPGLIAIDEAHCISQWGHDFRADYRKLGERLAAFSGVPKLALTATASPQVQDDIVNQLQLPSCQRFICGFRRTTLAIEVAVVGVSERLSALLHFLEDPAHRPAIVYVATRKDAEGYAQRLAARFQVGSYHAGMGADLRQEEQEAFLSGAKDIMVATVAFGMGIDKSNIRTVVHMALPSTLAGYYQEIGRAGRDGKAAKAVLMHSLADQRTQMFLHELNYPAVDDLKRLYQQIPEQGVGRSYLQSGRNDMDLDAHLQKLWVHGAIAYDQGGDVVYRLTNPWENSYRLQKEQRLADLQQMMAYADDYSRCRMVQLIRHFGDYKDAGEGCGVCDVCQPGQSYFKKVREPNPNELAVMTTIRTLVTDQKNWSSGTLYKLIADYHDISRDTFDMLVYSLVQAKYLDYEIASFTKNGHTIHYRQISLPHPSLRKKGPLTAASLQVVKMHNLAGMPRQTAPALAPSLEAKGRAAKPLGKPSKLSSHKTATRKKAERAFPADLSAQISESHPDADLLLRLGQWRRAVAKKEEVPAFCVLSNKTLEAIAESHPRSVDELLQVTGIGPSKVKKYGEEILSLLGNT